MGFAQALGLFLLGISIGTMFGHAVGYAKASRPRYRRAVTRSE
jgi:hypothetical protein